MKTEHQVEIDLDEVLDIEDDLEKRIFVKVSPSDKYTVH